MAAGEREHQQGVRHQPSLTYLSQTWPSGKAEKAIAFGVAVGAQEGTLLPNTHHSGLPQSPKRPSHAPLGWDSQGPYSDIMEHIRGGYSLFWQTSEASH